MSTQLRLEDIRRAQEAQDPETVRLISLLAEQPDKAPETPIREGAMTFDRFLSEIRSHAFRRKTDEEQAHYRVETMKALESPTAEVTLPDRLKLHEIILALWQDNGPFARHSLLKIIASVPLVYGPWRALKRIFKEAEAKNDTEIYGALAARFDAAQSGYGGAVSRLTLGYLARRAWRYLRQLGQRLPACYADTAVDFLAQYTDDTQWGRTWVANHIFFHESKKYGRFRFRFGYSTPDNLLKQRAFADLWRRSPRPLFALLERAKSDRVREFATSALKTDFRALLREVEPSWVVRLVSVRSAAIDEFLVWILNNVPKFEQGAFRTLGLHDAVLRLFDSPADAARAYAAEYARTHARDLPVAELIRLANNDHDAVRKLAFDLLQARDPRKDVGLDAWGVLLATEHGHELAATVLRKHFGAKELTTEWFADRLFSESEEAFEFAKKQLPQIHPRDKLGAAYFSGLIDRIDDPSAGAADRVAEYALEELARFDLNTLDREVLQRLLVHPLTRYQVCGWIDSGKLKTQSIPAAFFKVLAYHPAWETDPWVKSLRESNQKWARDLSFDESLADRVLGWLRDVRRFLPSDLGFDWLMQLVARSEPRYHDFAVETMVKSFVPADFAATVKPAAAAPSAESETKADLGGASFLFTGKLATMQRDAAETKVKQARGTVASGVTAKLSYLVIGDEGSPLYGQGKKGSKQVKAEEINAAGGNIKIVSETAFLQMLAGKPMTVSADATQAGCERLWEMLTAGGPKDALLGQFALHYIRRHHPDICLAETDRPVDPGAEIPATFLTLDRVKPLFRETREPLRAFALELAKWEFARWSPPAEEIIQLCEIPFGEVRKFVANALLAEDTPEHRRYRIDPDKLSPAAVYSFCESPDEQTRTLGMELIRRSPRLQVPEELFRLTESPDRRVRGFVVRRLWSLYRDRGITADWKPTVPAKSTVGKSKKAEKVAAAEAAVGPGAPQRPEKLPAPEQTLNEFLRRMLFELPPGRLPPPPKSEKGEQEGITIRLKPLAARKAKLSLVEMLRDLALEEGDLAKGLLPVLQEFMVSYGKSERDACLVAVTRIRKQQQLSAAK